MAGDGSLEPKPVAVCEVALKCCVGRHIFVYDIGKLNEMYQNNIERYEDLIQIGLEVISVDV